MNHRRVQKSENFWNVPKQLNPAHPEMNMNAGEITIIVLHAISLLWAAHKHGQDKDQKHNFWISFVSTILAIALLYWAGLFHV